MRSAQKCWPIRLSAGEVVKGDANQTLYINLDNNTIESRPVTSNEGHLHRRARLRPVAPVERVTPQTTWTALKTRSSSRPVPLRNHQLPRSGSSLVVTISPLTGS